MAKVVKKDDLIEMNGDGPGGGTKVGYMDDEILDVEEETRPLILKRRKHVKEPPVYSRPTRETSIEPTDNAELLMTEADNMSQEGSGDKSELVSSHQGPPLLLNAKRTRDRLEELEWLVDRNNEDSLEREIRKLEEQIDTIYQDNDIEQLKELCSTANNRKLLTVHLTQGEFSVLEKACVSYPVTVLKCLVEGCGPDIKNVSPKWGGNLLHYLPYWTNKDVFDKVKYLIDVVKLNPQETDNDGNLPMMNAFGADAVDVVKLFVNEYNIDVNHRNKKGQSLLQAAMQADAFKIACLLLEKDAIIDRLMETDELNYAKLLKFVISTGNLAVFIKLLLAINHNTRRTKRIINANDKDGTSLHVAAGLKAPTDKKHKQVKDDRFGQASTRNAATFVKELLRHGADTSAINANMEIPLHIAAKANDREIAELLLAHGDVKRQLMARNIHGGTLLHSAVIFNCLDVQNLFLENPECEPTVVDYKKRNIFHTAVDCGSDLQMLLMAAENQPDVKAQKWSLSVTLIKDMLTQVDRDGNSPVDVAANKGDTETVRRFLTLIETKDTDKGLSFRRAAEAGKLKTCEIIGSATGMANLHTTDDDGNSALHLAAAHGHLDVVRLLTIYSPPDKNVNELNQLPVHLAASQGHLDITQFLVSCDNTIANRKDLAGMTPLHYAAMFNRVDVVKCLIAIGGDVCIRDEIGRNVLDVAIDNNCFKVGHAILHRSNQWRCALMNDVEPRELFDLTREQLQLLGFDDVEKVFNSRHRETPLRRMIRKMPLLAKIVFDKCTDKVGNVEFLDDTYASWKGTGQENSEEQDKVYEKSGKLSKGAQRYVSDGRSFKANHPLTIMIKFSRDDLLDHPLVKALISYKCKLANGIYFAFMMIFLCMVTMATMFIVLSDPPRNANWSVNPCADYELQEQYPNYHTMWMQWCIWVMLSVCVAVEFIQFLALKVRYFIQPSNYFDWFCYSSMVLITINVTSCGVRTLWQWQLSAFCLLASWINMAMLLRRLPLIGIYVVMLTKVAQSFANFFTILLSFIVAFAVAFFILLQGQVSFSTLGYSVLKTAVMMTGEQDFGDIFFNSHSEDGHVDELRNLFKSSTLVVYVIFLPTMSIIVLNLLIGLAVGDINELMKNAKIERLGLSVDLALDVEQNMPRLIQRKLINKYVRMRSGVPRCIDKVLKLTKRLIFTEASQADNRLEQLFDDVKEQVNFNARKVAKDISQQVAELNQFKKEVTAETELIKQDLANQSIETKQLMKEMLQTLKKEIMTSQNAEIASVVRDLKQTLSDVKRYALQLRTQTHAQLTTPTSSPSS